MLKRFILLFGLALLLTNCDKESTTDLNAETSNWMSNLLKANLAVSVALKDIAIPASHDAVMYILQDCSLANACNTQTQYLNMKDQLEAGLRMFDIRPILYNGKYYTEHAVNCYDLGCKGDIMDNILTQTKKFVDSHAELVILYLSHFCGIEPDNTDFLAFLNNKLGDRIYKETTVNTVPFIKRPLTDFIPTSVKTGKVLLVFESGIANTPENKALGLFSGSILPMAGGWTDDSNFPELKQNQLTNFSNYENDSTRLFQFAWQITQNVDQAVACVLTPATAISIKTAAQHANDQLPVIADSLIAANAIRKGKIPNIIYVDYADAFITDLCLKLSKLNIE